MKLQRTVGSNKPTRGTPKATAAPAPARSHTRRAVTATATAPPVAAPPLLIQKTLDAYFRPATREYAAADAELERFYAEKKCEVCTRGYEHDAMRVCVTCDDAYHASCIGTSANEENSDDEDDNDNETWACRVCLADSALRERAAGDRLTPPSPTSTYQTALRRDFSSTWAQQAMSNARTFATATPRRRPQSGALGVSGGAGDGASVAVRQLFTDAADTAPIVPVTASSTSSSSTASSSSSTTIAAVDCSSKHVHRAPLVDPNDTSHSTGAADSKVPPVTPPRHKTKISDSYEAAPHIENVTYLQSTVSLDAAYADYHASLHILLRPLRDLEAAAASASSASSRKPRRRGSRLCAVPKRAAPLKLPRYSACSDEQRDEQRRALAAAMHSKQMRFHDEQSHPFVDCPPSANDPIGVLQLEPRMQRLDAASTVVFREAKKHTALGDYGCVRVVLDDKQGWVVEATADIASHTLVCEYVGEVDFTRHHLFDGDDDIMDLIRSGRSETSLVMCPAHRGNIGRFLSGVNNFTADGIKQVNVRSARFVIDGRSRVLLFTKRPVRRGERLYYDYNALATGYATQAFV